MKSRRPVNSDVMRLLQVMKAAIIFLLILAGPVPAQQLSAPDLTHVTITMTSDGSHCGCPSLPGSEISCCPEYSVSVDENGTVIYNGRAGSKVHGEKVHSISVLAVRDLVAEFLRIDFFSLQDRYESKKLPNGNVETIDHANANTISIDLDGKKKSVYIFYGAPEDLTNLQRKLYEVLQLAQYTGRA
jgi:hypothetical protein